MRKRLANLLNVRQGEGQLTLTIAALFFIANTSLALGLNTAATLFNLRVGPQYLPIMFILLGGINIPFSLLYSAGLNRFQQRRYFVTLSLLMALVIFAQFWLVPAQNTNNGDQLSGTTILIYPILWLTVSTVQMLLSTMLWNTAGDVTDTRQAKRLFALFGSAGTLGMVFGNTLIQPLTNLHNGQIRALLTWQAGLMLATMLMFQIIGQRFFREKAGQPRATLLQNVLAGYRIVTRSPLLRLVSITTILTIILFLAIYLPFNTIVAESIPDEAQNIVFMGRFSGTVTTITLLVSIFLANRLTKRIGVVNTSFSLVLAYLLGLGLLMSGETLTNAVIAKAAQDIVLNGLYISTSMVFFNVIAPDKRGQASSFVTGVVGQIGLILSGAFALVGTQVLSNQVLFQIGLALTLLTAFIIFLTRRGYRQALLDALSAGRIEIFEPTPTEHGIQIDTHTYRIINQALNDNNPIVRRIGIEMIGRLNYKAGIPRILQLLDKDTDLMVCVAALDTLNMMGFRQNWEKVNHHLNSTHPEVQQSALRGLSKQYDALPEYILAKVKDLLKAEYPITRTFSAVTMSRFGHHQAAMSTLNQLLADNQEQWETISAALKAINTIALEVNLEARDQVLALLDLETLTGLLKHPGVPIRRESCQTLQIIQTSETIAALLERLNDNDESVRLAAAAALQPFGTAIEDQLISILNSDNEIAQYAALHALDELDEAINASLVGYIQAEITRLKDWRQRINAFSLPGKASALLKEILKQRATSAELRLIKAFSLLYPGNQHEFELILESMQNNDPEMRATALETLDTLDVSELEGVIIAALEATTHDAIYEDNETALNIHGALYEMLTVNDPWLQALALLAIGELKLITFTKEVEKLAGHPDPTIQTAAQTALAQINRETIMTKKTLQTLSPLQRVILLREVPLFSGLTADDLRTIADLAHEEYFTAGEQFITQGDEGHELYIIAEGAVEVIIADEAGNTLVAQRGVGEFIGEMAILESAARSASVAALADTRTLVLTDEPFKAILRDRPNVALAVLSGLSTRVRELNQQILELR